MSLRRDDCEREARSEDALLPDGGGKGKLSCSTVSAGAVEWPCGAVKI